MKLQDVKERIDNFFDNITAEKLYEISVLKYNFRYRRLERTIKIKPLPLCHGRKR